MMHRTHFAMALLALAGCQAAQQSDAPRNTYTGVDSHARWLPLSGTSHVPTATGPIRCEGCHTTPDTFSRFECTGCHAEAATTAIHTPAGSATPIAGFAWASADCLGCHATGGMTDADHGVFFPIGAAAKHPRTCRSCHSDPLDKQSLPKLLCVSCHADTAVFPLPGLDERHVHATEPARLPVLDYPVPPSPADCLRCHDDSRVTFIASHGKPGPGQVDNGQVVHDSRCFTCHQSQGVPNRPWAQRWGSTSCKPCHN